MKITRLRLFNFGIYAGNNEFIFNNKKPVVLIGGMNGRGKTTFLEAVLLALYGANSFAVIESKHKSYSSYLKAHINCTDNTNEASITMEFQVSDDQELNEYSVNRSWNGNSRLAKDNIKVYKNKKYDLFLSENWSMFIESILPSALANFYFFDGEKIAELAETETNMRLKNSIKSLMGITVIDTLENDLKKLINRVNKSKIQGSIIETVSQLRNNRDKQLSDLESIDNKIQTKKTLLSDIEKRIVIQQEELSTKGGNIANNASRLYQERGMIINRINSINESFIELAATELPLMMTESLLKIISDQSDKEKEWKSNALALKRLNSLFKMYKKENPGDNLFEFMTFANEMFRPEDEYEVYDLTDSTSMQLHKMLEGRIKTKAELYKKQKRDLITAKKRLDELDNYLSIDIDEKQLKSIYRKINKLEKRKIIIESELKELTQKRTLINSEFILASQEFNRFVENALSKMEKEEDEDRLVIYAMLAQKTAEKYKLELQKDKIELLSETMTECYRKLVGKQNFICSIKIDPVVLEYTCSDDENRIVDKNSLSAGEKQLMVIAMLWALAICSNRQLPVIIDTPLARLDQLHRKTLLQKYFPYASNQTIILSTDSEIDDELYSLIKEHVSDEYTIIYDENAKSSKVVKGYFKTNY